MFVFAGSGLWVGVGDRGGRSMCKDIWMKDEDERTNEGCLAGI